ncbi:LysR substrate-binding domain-containing protein [Hydrogenophaga sp.]|uniref:LysR substrate-binding domain-containing protein n=1 Tax=Hydrogenophaga sp. TaxID=1904254 RepID=UPI000E96C93B|nr:LysR substrate-binding domain-containing protein [Hydrogenophaga sp.]HBU18486.1 LysR family transcriptional regulator [Hydrogenophaga sp.]
MPLTLDALAILDAIDRKGSFARAAEELARAPSSLTYAVQQIEAELDVLLFDRSGHRARFTPAGRVLLDEGRTLLNAAHALENKARQVAGGWEPQFTLALEGILPVAPVLPLLEDFYSLGHATEIRLRHEVLAGGWDALACGRADLAIAGGDAPAGGGLRTRALGTLEFVFCVAPQHPLARIGQPLSQADIAPHRAVVIADTALNLPLRSAGWLQQQPRLTVADLPSKLAAQQAGLGVGSLPRWLADREVAAGRLVRCEWVGGNPRETLQLAWRSGEAGRALDWFIRALSRPDAFAGVLDAD